MRLLRLPARAAPFVHSMGGPYITISTKLYGYEVPGLVYVGASHPDQKEHFEAALGNPLEDQAVGRVGSEPEIHADLLPRSLASSPSADIQGRQFDCLCPEGTLQNAR